MAELDGLKKRVELIDVRLKTARSARERESAALMETWEQIRDRFRDQSAEVTNLRGQVADLEDARDGLLNMVRSLLETVESVLDSTADETMPQIKILAGQLLSNTKDEIPPTETAMKTVISEYRPSEYESEYESEDESGQETAAAPSDSSAGTNFHDNLLAAIERTIDSTNKDDFVDAISPPITSEIVAETDSGVPASTSAQRF